VEHLTLSLTLSAVACDGILALLAVVALARLGAVRWSAQFTLLPLLIVLEGIVLVRPTLSTRWVVGLLLLAVASVFLLMPPEPEEETSGRVLPR
jgi:threonine/homoserine efflux transporter RhtA